MSKVDILRLDSVTTNDTKATTTINTNFQNIQSVIETLLSRTGVTPNYMDAVLDMNSYRIINTAMPAEDFDVVNLKYLRDYVGNLETLVSQATEAAQAAAAQAQNAASSSNIAVSAAQTAIEARDTTINTYLQIQEIKTDVEEIAESIEGIADDPNVIAVGEDLRDPNSSIKGAKEAAESAQASAEAADNSAISANTSANSAENAKDLAVAAASSAQTASNLSQDWAIKTDGPVSGSEYSAKYWAQQASVGAVTDNKSINRNSNDELQTVGVIDQNNTSTALKEWSGTTQEYTAIQTKDTNTIYNVLEDGIYKGSTQIAAYVSSGGYHPDLLSFQWSDHLLNNVSWLRADTFSWQDGTVYEAAYNKLVEDFSTGTIEYAYKPWTQPILSENGIIGGNSFAVTASSSHDNRQAYKAFDGNNTTKWGINDSANTEFLIFYNPKPLRIKKVTQYFTSDYPNEDYGTYTLYGSYSGQDGTWLQIATAQIWNSYEKSKIEYLCENSSGMQYFKIEISGNHYNFSGIGELVIDAEEFAFEYKRTTNGFNIVNSTYINDVEDLYNTSGIAWYYILDTTNQRFKLPRTKFGFTGVRTGAGLPIQAGLPDITGTISFEYQPANTGSYKYWSGIHNGEYGRGWNNTTATFFDAKISNNIYGNSDTVQPPATQMYLYFYVGDYTQTAIEQTAGLNSELFNDKLDLDLGNLTNTSKETIIDWAMPDYTAGIDVTNIFLSGEKTYTPSVNGYLNAFVDNNNEFNIVEVTSNARIIFINGESYEAIQSQAPVLKGQTYKNISSRSGNSVIFYPMKGTQNA